MAQPPDKVASTNIISQQDESVPSYITSAAAIISEALILESEEKYSESVEAYRSAIGKLLSEVQSDPDLIRQAAVKKRVAQYISKAEQLVERELDARCGPQTRQPTSSSQGIPHLHLFSHLSELRQYKVLDIIDGKVILAHHRETKQKVIFKVLQKSSAVYKKSKTSLLPINIKFMVNLLKYWETDNAVFLMLEYYPAGKLWHLVQPLVQQQLQEPGCERISVDLSQAEASNIPPILKPSKSFIMTREKVVSESLDTDSDLGDMNYVHSSNNSLLVISNQQIQHYSMDEDLNPDNVLLDDSGHIKLSYQCEWVSVERTLSSTAVRGRFIAPEVLSPMEISRSADWWSFGAILLLLYTGEGPSSLIPSGLDSTIPISFPSYVSKDAIQFVSSFLEVNPERRLGASSTGHMDIRTHKYFNNFDWEQNMFTDKL